MAREVVYTDDLDGTHGAEPVKFGWDEIWWEIDLSEANREKLLGLIQPYLDKARPPERGTAPAAPARQRRGARAAEEKIDYATAEHAGYPHQGRVSPAEAEYVREHLDAVNARLKTEGKREIDPSDPKVAERYGL